MLKTIVGVLVCVSCMGTASSSYIKSFVDMYRMMAPFTSLPPLTIKGLTDDEKQSLDGGLKFASGLTGMGSELLVTGANNASDVAHHGLQSALHFAERAIVEGSKLATQGLDILDEIEKKAPHYAGTIRNAVPLVGSRSLGDVKTDVSSLHSNIIPDLNQVVGKSHVLVDKAKQFFQKIVNIVNDIIQIVIALAQMAITGDIGEIEKYEKDLMLRTTGTTDPGGTDISKAEQIGSILRNAGKYTATEHWNSSGRGTVTGDPEVSLKKQLDETGNNGVSRAGIIEGQHMENAVDGGESEDRLKQKAPIVVIGETEVVGSVKSSEGNSTSTLESDNVDQVTPGFQNYSPAGARSRLDEVTEHTDRSDTLKGKVIPHETSIDTLETINRTADDGNSLGGNSSVNSIQAEYIKPETKQVPHQEEEAQADPHLGEYSSVSAGVKPNEADHSWSFFGMMVNAVKNTAKSIKNAVVGRPKTDTRGVQDRVQNATAAGSVIDLYDIISGARGIDEDHVQGNDDSSKNTTGTNSRVEFSSALEQTVGLGDVDQKNESISAQEETIPEKGIQMAGLENNDLASHINPQQFVSAISGDPPQSTIIGSTSDQHATEHTDTIDNNVESVGNYIPHSLKHITLGTESNFVSDIISGARDLEGDSVMALSELNTSASSSIIPSLAQQVSTVSSVAVQRYNPEGALTVIDAELSNPHKNEIREDRILGTQINETDAKEKKAVDHETVDGKKTLSQLNLVVENNSGARGLVVESNSEPTNDTNNSVSPSGLNFFGQFVQFVGKAANAVVSSVTTGGAKVVENVAHSVSKSVTESVTPEDTKFFEKLANNITNVDIVSNGEELVSNSGTVKGSPSDVINGAYDLNLGLQKSDKSSTTYTSSVIPTIAENTLTGNEELLSLPKALKQTKPQLTGTGVEEQLAKPDNVDQVTPGFQYDSPAGARSLLDELTDHTNQFSMANTANSNDIPSVSGFITLKHDNPAAISEVAEQIKTNEKETELAPKGDAQSAKVGNLGDSPQGSLTEEQGFEDKDVTTIKDSNTKISSSSATSSAQKPNYDSVRPGIIIVDTPASSNAADITNTSSGRRDPEPSSTSVAGENKVLKTAESIISGARGLDTKDTHTSNYATGITSPIAISFSPKPDAVSQDVNREVLDSPRSTISSGRGLEDGGYSTGATNIIVPQAPATSSGVDLFGRIVQFVGKVASNTATAVVETVAPESVKFVENLTSNLTKAVVESIAPEDKRFVETLAQTVFPGMSAGGDLNPGPASIPSDGMLSGARGLDVKYIPERADSGPTFHNNEKGGAVPSENEGTTLHALFSTTKTPQIEPNSEDHNQKTEDSITIPTDGGWIFVNVVNSKPQLFFAPEGNPITIDKKGENNGGLVNQ